MLLFELFQQLTPQSISGKGYIHSQTLQVINADYHLPHVVVLAKHGRQMGIDPAWLEKNVPTDPSRVVFWATDNDTFFGPIQNQIYGHHWVRFRSTSLSTGRKNEVDLSGVLSDIQDLITSRQFGAIVIKLANPAQPFHIRIDYVETLGGNVNSIEQVITTPVEFNELKRKFAGSKIIESKRK